MIASLNDIQILEFKSAILKQCKILLEEKLNNLISSLNEITESSNSESKSSAGDKHETSKAMMQIEQEKLSKQMSELKIQKAEFEKIIPNINRQKVIKGSLIETNHGLFFIAIAVGQLNSKGQKIFVISQYSPIGSLFLGATDNKFNFNNIEYKIETFV